MSDLFIDLGSAALGGTVIEANDEFFAPKENLLSDADPVWQPDRYTDRGKWMDGWETRRRRDPGHDWAIVRLGLRGVLRQIVVDTAHFTGNYPEACSIEAADMPGEPSIVDLVRHRERWSDAVPRSALHGNTLNRFAVDNDSPVTHVRLVIYPDGGIARLRCLGDPLPPDGSVDVEIDLAAVTNGGRAIDCSDRHYSSPNRMLMPGTPKGMWDGWETRRRRGPGHDWAVVRLAGPGEVRRLVVDTTHFKGNAPGTCDVEAIAAAGAGAGDLRDAAWSPLLARTVLSPDRRHELTELEEVGEVTHIRLNIHPDGGIARLSAFGTMMRPWKSPI